MDNPIRRPAAPTDGDHLDALEAHLGAPLPPEYRVFLLAHNGGVPARNAFTYTNSKGRTKTARVTWSYPLGREGLVDAAATDLLSAHLGRPVGLPRGLFPIGDVNTELTFGTLCIWYDGASGRCRHYDDRPRACRAFAVGGVDCLDARRRAGLG